MNSFMLYIEIQILVNLGGFFVFVFFNLIDCFFIYVGGLYHPLQ